MGALGECPLLLQEGLVVEEHEVVVHVALALVLELAPEGGTVALTPGLDVLVEEVCVALHEGHLLLLVLPLQGSLQSALGSVAAEEGVVLDLVHESSLLRRELLDTEVGVHLAENFLTVRRLRARKGTGLGGTWDFNFFRSWLLFFF